MIENVHDKLISLFYKKEDELCDLYKQEMYKT